MGKLEKEQINQVNEELKAMGNNANVKPAKPKDLGTINDDKVSMTPLFIMLGVVIVLLVVFILIKLNNKPTEEPTELALTYNQPVIEVPEDYETVLTDYIKKTTKEVVEERYANSVFVGDSLTEGISYYGYQELDHVVAKRGTSILQATEKVKKIAKKKPDYVFIMLGINDLNNSVFSMDDIESNYKKLVEKVHDALPDSKIYVESLLPVTATFAKSHKMLSNKRINSLNKRLKGIAKKYDYAEYLDVHSIYVNKKGCLPSKISADGYHLYAETYKDWIDYVKKTLKKG